MDMYECFDGDGELRSLYAIVGYKTLKFHNYTGKANIDPHIFDCPNWQEFPANKISREEAVGWIWLIVTSQFCIAACGNDIWKSWMS